MFRRGGMIDPEKALTHLWTAEDENTMPATNFNSRAFSIMDIRHDFLVKDLTYYGRCILVYRKPPQPRVPPGGIGTDAEMILVWAHGEQRCAFEALIVAGYVK